MMMFWMIGKAIRMIALWQSGLTDGYDDGASGRAIAL